MGQYQQRWEVCLSWVSMDVTFDGQFAVLSCSLFVVLTLFSMFVTIVTLQKNFI